MITPEEYFTKRHPVAFPIWQKAVVGIAGAGGLGSNIAISLARAGIGKLIIADFDSVSLENLNRQQFTISQVDQPKVHALAANINSFNPFISLEAYCMKVTPDNLITLFGNCDILIEAFDDASQKEMLIQNWLEKYPQKPVIGASGIAGYGNSESIRIHRLDNLYIVGDTQSMLEEGISPIAPRVAIVANLQADLALELLAKQDTKG
ncbi:MAG: thiamine biosynthesis protein ThiF [Candidatus Cloacimonetes bacterium HGW-Cloacimonetes-3]|jgi:sulfur carrier protein ThiS adenylyltransferase|nr:MAG: thiamine biosynthesis protein ThiF [Candidatus Cloacimonetes bacterium HGW-Cloacimonetes-3]